MPPSDTEKRTFRTCGTWVDFTSKSCHPPGTQGLGLGRSPDACLGDPDSSSSGASPPARRKSGSRASTPVCERRASRASTPDGRRASCVSLPLLRKDSCSLDASLPDGGKRALSLRVSAPHDGGSETSSTSTSVFLLQWRIACSSTSPGTRALASIPPRERAWAPLAQWRRASSTSGSSEAPALYP